MYTCQCTAGTPACAYTAPLRAYFGAQPAATRAALAANLCNYGCPSLYLGTLPTSARASVAAVLAAGHAYVSRATYAGTTICPVGVYASMLAAHPKLCPPSLLPGALALHASASDSPCAMPA